MTTTNQYVLPFGKYKGMYACDVAEITVVDKNGNDKNVGLLYLQWLCHPNQSWFRDTEIIKKIIEEAKTNMSDADEEPESQPEPPKKEKKEPKKKSINIEHNQVLKF